MHALKDGLELTANKVTENKRKKMAIYIVKFAWEMFVTESPFSLFLDVKECSMADNVCQNGGTCDERMGYYICNCRLGFAGKNCTKGMAESFYIN